MQELPVSRGPQLKLKLDGTERNPILVIRLMNGGSSPIVVDAEMVFLVGVEIRAVDGTKVDFETFGVVDRTGASAEEWRKRFKELAPGELAERRMALKESFRSFVCGIGSTPSRDGMWVSSETTGYEELCRLPESVERGDISEITVSYQAYGASRSCLESYTGLDPAALGLFEGPLSAALTREEITVDTEDGAGS